MRNTSPAARACLGFIAGAISVLTFLSAMWEVFHLLAVPGLSMPPPYPTAPTEPFGVPMIVSFCFWGGLYGAVFGLLMPRFSAPLWLCGLGLGIVAALVSLFVVAPLKHTPIAGGWMWQSWLRSFLINGFWGIGVGLIAPLLMSRRRTLRA